MELKVGIRAPDFTLSDSHGKDVALSNVRPRGTFGQYMGFAGNGSEKMKR